LTSSRLELRPNAGSASAAEQLLSDLARDSELTMRVKPTPKPEPRTSFAVGVGWGLSPSRPYTRFSIPQWVPVAVVLLPVAWIIGAAALRVWKRRSRRRHGLCVACGYDLRGAPDHPCPECGLTPA
jgi:hypothetical protein